MADDRLAKIQQASSDIEAIVSECGVTALAHQAPLVQAIQLADGIRRMRELLTEPVVKKYFMPLQGSPLGFVTDKDKDGGYDWVTVRDVVTEGLLRGFRPVGNEVNIIAGRFYGAKAGFERIVHEFPGVSEIRVDLGVPEPGPSGTALVSFDASWRYQGHEEIMTGRAAKDGAIDSRISVRVNSGMGPDAVLGKATRKVYGRIYRRLTGCARDLVELEPGDYTDTTATRSPAQQLPEGRRMSLRGKPADDVDAAFEREVVAREPVEEG